MPETEMSLFPMKIDWTYWQVFLPIVVLLALFSCTGPPKTTGFVDHAKSNEMNPSGVSEGKNPGIHRPDPLALRVIEIDPTAVIDLGPLTWPEKEETE